MDTLSISGTPTAAGIFDYTVTTTSGCSPEGSATGSINVNASSTVSLSSAIGTDAQTIEVNSAISDITYQVSGSSATADGLPSGTTGTFSAGVFTISGTPTVTGSFDYTVTTTGGCSPDGTATGNITVNASTFLIAVNTNNVKCKGGNSGEAWVSVSGGSGTYSYSWNTSPIQTTATATGLSAGAYTVTVIDTGNSDTLTESVIITEPATALAITIATISNVNCDESVLGSAQASGTGGSGSYAYSWSDGQTTATATGLAVGTYTVSITDNNGCTVPASTTVSIGKDSLSVSANSLTINIGETATLTASGASSYTWSNGETTSSINVSPVATTSYTVTGTSGSCSASTTCTVTIKPAPTVTVTDATICLGESFTINAAGADTYEWTGGGITATGSNITVSPNVTTTYTVIGTSGSLKDTATSTVVVNPLPVVVANQVTICQGQTATLTAEGADTYEWSTGETIASINVSPTSTTSYTVTGTTTYGCQATAEATVTIFNTTITPATLTINKGESVTLTASGATTYLWNTGETTQSISVTPSATTSYTVTGSFNTCESTAESTITVDTTKTLRVDDATICSGGTTTLTAFGADSYEWSTGETNSSINVSPTATTTYTVVGTIGSLSDTTITTVMVNTTPTISVSDATGCEGNAITITASGNADSYVWDDGSTGATYTAPSNTTASTYTHTVTATIGGNCPVSTTGTITVEPVPTIYVNNSTICSGSTTTLTASGTNSFIWSSGTNSSSITVSPSTTVTYTVIGTSNGCSSTAVSTVIVYQLPIVAVNSDTICQGETAELIALFADTYVWDDGETTSPKYVTPSTTTSYTVSGSNVYGCTASATSTVHVIHCTPQNWPLELYVQASDASDSATCDGEALVYVGGGTPPYTLTLGNKVFTDSIISIDSLCSGYYTIGAKDANNDTTSYTFVVGVTSQFFVNIPPTFLDSLVNNDVFTPALPNCDIDYDNIDSMKIETFDFVSFDTVGAIWSIFQGGTVSTQQVNYSAFEAGVNRFFIDLFCASRAIGVVRGSDLIYIDPTSIGIEDLNSQEQLVVYPNPFDNSITIELEKNATVSIRTVYGSEVYNSNLPAGINTINTQSFAAGVYLISVSNEGGIATSKMIKQ